MTSISFPPRPLHWLMMMGVALIWGTSFMMMSVALDGFGPISIAAYRITLGGALLIGLAFAQGKGLPPVHGRTAGLIWLCALGMAIFSNALPFFLLSWGQQYVASGFAGVTMAAVPLLILPLAHFLVPGERATPLRVIGFTIGFIGVVLLIGPSALRSLGIDNEATARLACLSAAGCYAVGAIITRVCPEVSKISLAAAALLVAAIISLPLALLIEGVPTQVPVLPMIAVLALGVVSTGLANLILVKVVREAGANFFALVNYQVPVWSLFFGWLVLSEVLPGQFFVALALILTGMALGQWQALKSLVRPARQ